MKWGRRMSDERKTITVDTARGDVTGDGVPDFVTLRGTLAANSVYVEDLMLTIQDGRSGRTRRFPVKFSGGYSPTLFLGDFTGDGINNILIRMDTGGSGAITNNVLYSYKNNSLLILFDSDVYNVQYAYEVEYLDHYLVKVVSRRNHTMYLISIAYKGREYLDAIYDEDGRLRHPIQGVVSPLSGLFPVDIERNGVYELFAYQQISGQFMADGLGTVQNILHWKAMHFELMSQTVGIYGGAIK